MIILCYCQQIVRNKTSYRKQIRDTRAKDGKDEENLAAAGAQSFLFVMLKNHPFRKPTSSCVVSHAIVSFRTPKLMRLRQHNR